MNVQCALLNFPISSGTSWNNEHCHFRLCFRWWHFFLSLFHTHGKSLKLYHYFKCNIVLFQCTVVHFIGEPYGFECGRERSIWIIHAHLLLNMIYSNSSALFPFNFLNLPDNARHDKQQVFYICSCLWRDLWPWNKHNLVLWFSMAIECRLIYVVLDVWWGRGWGGIAPLSFVL